MFAAMRFSTILSKDEKPDKLLSTLRTLIQNYWAVCQLKITSYNLDLKQDYRKKYLVQRPLTFW